jgi:hypothetical protein
VDADLDTLATALYVTADDLIKAWPGLAPARPAVGIAPQLTDAELVTLAVIQAHRGFVSERRVLRNARTWSDGPSTATAPATRAASGAFGCTWYARSGACRSPSR